MDSEALSNKLFKAVAQREKVDILPIDRLMYIPAKKKPKKSEKEEVLLEASAAIKEDINDNMITVEK